MVSIYHHSRGLCGNILHRCHCVVFFGGHLWETDLESTRLTDLLLGQSKQWGDGGRSYEVWRIHYFIRLCSGSAGYKHCCQLRVCWDRYDGSSSTVSQHQTRWLHLCCSRFSNVPMVSRSHCHRQADYLLYRSQEPPLQLQQFHNLPIRLFGLPLLHCRRYHLRLLYCPPRLLRDQGPLLSQENVTLLLHFRLPLARIHSLYLRYSHQYCRLCWRHWEACAPGCQIHLQYQLLRRLHRRVPDILGLVQGFSHSGLQ